MKVYISGKISGIESKAPLLFEAAERELLSYGHSVVNPMKLPHDHDKSWHSYMKDDIRAMCDCDAIYMLRNWTDSKGAIVEHGLAATLGLKLIYESNAMPATWYKNEFSAR